MTKFVTIFPINKQRKMATDGICQTCGIYHSDEGQTCEDTFVFLDNEAKDVLKCGLLQAPTFQPHLLPCCGRVVDKSAFDLYCKHRITHGYLRCPCCRLEPLNAVLVKKSMILCTLADVLQVYMFMYLCFLCIYVFYV